MESQTVAFHLHASCLPNRSWLTWGGHDPSAFHTVLKAPILSSFLGSDFHFGCLVNDVYIFFFSHCAVLQHLYSPSVWMRWFGLFKAPLFKTYTFLAPCFAPQPCQCFMQPLPHGVLTAHLRSWFLSKGCMQFSTWRIKRFESICSLLHTDLLYTQKRQEISISII